LDSAYNKHRRIRYLSSRDDQRAYLVHFLNKVTYQQSSLSLHLFTFIYLLIFTFHLRRSNTKSKKRKDIPVTLYNDPYNPDYFNKPLGSDDLYMASQVGLNAVNNANNNNNSNNNNTSLNPNGSALVKKDSALWKSSESLNVFANRFQAEQSLPTTTWPRIATDP
jgi:hypothetical protein